MQARLSPARAKASVAEAEALSAPEVAPVEVAVIPVEVVAVPVEAAAALPATVESADAAECTRAGWRGDFAAPVLEELPSVEEEQAAALRSPSFSAAARPRAPWPSRRLAGAVSSSPEPWPEAARAPGTSASKASVAPAPADWWRPRAGFESELRAGEATPASFDPMPAALWFGLGYPVRRRRRAEEAQPRSRRPTECVEKSA